ncbi:MAG: hypothetical protein DRR16_00715 [Candidatus Parabeggiatoa sp. nov. 3]|jgi:hypothetical protein|nr:MAG: hypothetical protein DRR00_03110 [Gammaproteobacteria bacterium]RKZ90070.1 MAG: hypothetical protein DRR16_00715 [Gammaproteobacteria bacterium]
MEITTTHQNDASKTVAVFCSIMAGVFALVCYLIQQGYPFQLEIDRSHFYDSKHFFSPILSALVLSIFLLNFPQAYRILENKFKLSFRNTWLTSDATLSLIGLIILIIAGKIFSFYILPIFYLISFILFAYVFYTWFKGGHHRHSYLFIAMSILFSIWVTSHFYGYWMKHPLYFEGLIFFESLPFFKGFKDVLFHSAIINMIQLHGVASSGLNGIPSFFYHFGTHWIFTDIIKLLGTSTITFYNIALAIIFIPFWFSSLLLLAINLKKWREKSDLFASWHLRSDIKFWLILFVANIGLLYYPLAHDGLFLYWNLHIHLASYSLSLTFSFLFIGMLLSFAVSHNRILTKKTEPIFLILVLPFMVALIGFTKLTTVFLILAFLFYLFIRLKLYKSVLYNLSFLIISGMGIAIVIISLSIAFSAKSTVDFGSQATSIIYPFHFLRTWLHPSMWLVFLFFCCFWSILFITLRLWYEKSINHSFHLNTLFIDRKWLDIEIVMLFCIAGLLPGMIFHLPPYNQITSATGNVYFYDFQNWIGVSFLLASLSQFNFLIKRSKKLVFILLIPVMVGSYYVVVNYHLQVSYLYKTELHLSQLIKNNPNYLSTTEGRILKLLHQIGRDMPVSEKKKTLVFIPQSNTDFWNAKFEVCYAIPFSVPAITGMAMLDGFPPSHCKPMAFSYENYENSGMRTKKQTNTNDKALCSQALDKEFSQILRIDNIYTQPRLIACEKK